MAVIITIDRSGRLVIPKDVRDRHQLRAGSRLQLLEDEERLILVPLQAKAATKEVSGLLVFKGVLTDAVPDHRDLRELRLSRLSEK